MEAIEATQDRNVTYFFGGNGGAAYGGGIANGSSLTLENCTMTGNTAIGGSGGGPPYLPPPDFVIQFGDGAGAYTEEASMTQVPRSW